jgi:hypothetical protein
VRVEEAYGELAQLDEAHDEFDAVALGEAVDGALLLQLPQLLLKRQLLCAALHILSQSMITPSSNRVKHEEIDSPTTLKHDSL